MRQRLNEAHKSGEVVNLRFMYGAVALDVINNYCFARNPEAVIQPDFGRQGFEDLDGFLEVSIVVS